MAVNLQEEPKQITAMLERHKLKPEVVLDSDGAVAEKYAANAIPQTVIIDRNGRSCVSSWAEALTWAISFARL